MPIIGILLKKSTNRLSEDIRDCFIFLGGLAPKPATFSLEDMEDIWGVKDARPIAKLLIDRGLLELIPENGQFWMHAILVKHAYSLALTQGVVKIIR